MTEDNQEYTYTRRVQIRNAEGELVEHVISANSIMELDAQYFRLVRESEPPPAPNSAEESSGQAN